MNHIHMINAKTIRGKIMSATSVTTVVIALVTVTVCFSIFQSFLKKNQIQSAEFNLQIVSNNVSTDMKDIIYFSKWCCSNRDILNYLSVVKERENLAIASRTDIKIRQTALSAFDRVKEEYHSTKPSSYTSSYASSYIERVIISSENTNNFLQIMMTSGGNSSYASTIVAGSDFFPSLYNADDYVWNGLVQNPFVKSTDEPVIPLVRPVYDEFSTDTIGWTYLAISPTIITDYLYSFPLEKDSRLFITIGGKTYAVTEHHLTETPLDYTTLGDLSDHAINPETGVSSIRFADGSIRTMVTFPLSVDGWYLSQVLSQHQLDQQRQLYIGIVVVICMIILTLGIILGIYMNRTISQPVEKVRQKIDRIAGGDFSLEPAIEWEHEIGDIGRGINHLSQEIVSLMDRRVADEKQKKDLEYQILQSQINPHFLYNTLNSIKWMATIQNAAGIAEMTTALARLLKNISKGTTALIPLREELELVNDYFLIQQYRYGGSVTLTYEIPDEAIYDCLIHRFTLQPIIENALFHGIEPKGCAGRITLRADLIRQGQTKILQLSVTDNGLGMSPENIRQILSGEVSPQAKTDFFKQVGIRNVNQRIKYEFGEKYGITIESIPGEYTAMIIAIPYQTGL